MCFLHLAKYGGNLHRHGQQLESIIPIILALSTLNALKIQAVLESSACIIEYIFVCWFCSWVLDPLQSLKRKDRRPGSLSLCWLVIFSRDVWHFEQVNKDLELLQRPADVSTCSTPVSFNDFDTAAMTRVLEGPGQGRDWMEGVLPSVVQRDELG